MLETIINSFQECNALLTKLKTEISPNPISFLVHTSEIVSSLRIKSEKYIEITEKVINNLLKPSTERDNDNIIDHFLEHDPGKRKQVESLSQRKYLLSLGPCQPKLAKYPKNSDISPKKQNQFTSVWFTEYPHLEYSIVNDAVYCFICTLFPKGPNRQFADPAWVENGVRAWSKMKSRGKQKPGKLTQHFTSLSHKSALDDFSNFLNSSNHIDCLLNKSNRVQAIELDHKKRFHQDILCMLFDISRTLARQGLAYRGDGDEQNSNFNQIVLLLSRHSPVMKRWLEEKSFRNHKTTYLSHDSQNEFIKLLADDVKKTIIKDVTHAGIYSVMADTTPDISRSDQLSVCVRYIDSLGDVSERLLEVCQTKDKTGLGVAEKIYEVLVENSLPVENIAFQSYDYASSMSGRINGTQQKLSELAGHMIPFIPCQAHRLNTFLEHSCDASILICDLFSTLENLYVFFSASTKRHILLKSKLATIENSLQLRNLSKTRWTARAESIKAVWVSFEIIIETLQEIINLQGMDKNTRNQALGLVKKLLSFDFVVSLLFMKNIMYKTKILTEKLEATELNILDALMLIDYSISSLNEMNSDDTATNNLVSSAITFSEQLGIDPVSDFNRHHRKRLLPKRIDQNPNTQCSIDLPTFYRVEFKKVLNNLIVLLNEHLKKSLVTFEPMITLFKMPWKQICSTENVKKVIELFPPGCKDFKMNDYDGVIAELKVLDHQCNVKKLDSLTKIFKLSEDCKTCLPTANKLCRLVLTAPVSTASNERAFSKLKIVKNYLRSTMGADRLQHLMLLYSNKDILDCIDLKSSVKSWSLLKERRIII
jgi:hypothetical protein